MYYRSDVYFSLLLNKMLSSKHHRLIGYPNNKCIEEYYRQHRNPQFFQEIEPVPGLNVAAAASKTTINASVESAAAITVLFVLLFFILLVYYRKDPYNLGSHLLSL